MAPTIYRSTDASAPVLHGNAGSLIAVLDGCLVNGYGAQTALGWSKAFSGTNLASYRASAGVQHYLDVDDSAPDATALGRNARVRGYETMSAVGTGTGLFPTTTQVTTSVGIVKSTATGTTARPWLLIGDDRTFYLFAEPAGTDPPNLATHTWTSAMYFGEFLSALSGDNYRSMIAWQTNTTTAATASLAAFAAAQPTSATAVNTSLARTYTGAGAACWATLLGAGMYSSTSTYQSDQPPFTFPNTVDGGLYLNSFDIFERTSGTTPTAATGGAGCRGRLRGAYQTLYTTAGYNDQDTFSGV
jgi:hypothetical protein